MTAPRAHRSDSPHRLRPPAVTARLRLFAAALAAALGGALVAYFLNVEEPATAALPEPLNAAPGQPASPASQAAAVQAAAGLPTAVAPPKPAWLKPASMQTPGLTLAELQELRATLATTPDPSGEFTRLSEQVLLSDATQRFLQLRASGSGNDEELQGLVQLIGPVLDAQLQRGELSRADALDLKWKLVQAQYPQAAMQQAELARWLAAHPAR